VDQIVNLASLTEGLHVDQIVDLASLTEGLDTTKLSTEHELHAVQPRRGNPMNKTPFHTEPQGYIKGAWSDLQGAWVNLRQAVVDAIPFPEAQRILWHIDEGMSWESVREPDNMSKALLPVQNIARQAGAPEEVLQWIDRVGASFEEVMEAIRSGNAR
jgi:hypothetical protein